MKQLPSFPQDTSLSALQAYSEAICQARGWDQTNSLETFLLLSEEMGELAKAIRNRINLFQEEGKQIKEGELEGEFADVLSYLLQLANQFGIDLAEAYRQKEEENAQRSWD
ncbi:MAG: MazG nucleotide pyrophosphohydrolase domain-containing protein [Bacteroidota bacterium]